MNSLAHYREAGFVGAGGGQVVLEASATQLDLRHRVIINWIFVDFFPFSELDLRRRVIINWILVTFFVDMYLIICFFLKTIVSECVEIVMLIVSSNLNSI